MEQQNRRDVLRVTLKFALRHVLQTPLVFQNMSDKGPRWGRLETT
ncbi:MAG: hypothetical protein WKF84_07160 [Pyrinomonadaceae bacterium]